MADRDVRNMKHPRRSSHPTVTTSTQAGTTARHWSTGTRSSVVVRSGGVGFGYPSYSYGGYPYYGYSYYPYRSYGYSYYPYDYGYPYDYSYGYYHYHRPVYGHAYDASIVVQVQTRLARAGYYHGPIDGVMGPRTHYAIRAYERDHGLRADGVISRQLMVTMGLRY